MSLSKQLIINCGASRITAGVISSDEKRLRLEKLVTENLDHDLCDDEAWLGAVSVALRKLHRDHKLSGNASFIIPGNQVLNKTIRIPKVEASKRRQVIAFEAQQNIPYPLHEVVWDSQIISEDEVETEVLFVACKSNTIDAFCREISDSGFVVESINAAAVLDYNAIQVAFPETDEDVLLINIGARSTNLLFKNSKGFFVRNIQLGGNSLTQNIADGLGSSFTRSEEIKHRFFDRKFDASKGDSGAEVFSAASDSFARRMQQEITRSIVNYRRQTGSGAPKRILLSGRGALLKGLSEKLSTSQKMSIEYFDPLKNVECSPELDSRRDEIRHQSSEIIGHAAREIIRNGAEVNLLPEKIRQQVEFNSKKPYLIIAGILLAIAPWPVFFGYKQLEPVYQDQAGVLQAKISLLQEKQNRIRSNEDKIREVRERVQQIEGLVKSRNNWIQFFAELQDSLAQAEDAWLDSLEVLRKDSETGTPTCEVFVGGQILVRENSAGVANVDRASLARLLKNLQSSMESSRFVVASKPPMIDWSILQGGGLPVLPFTIHLIIDESKLL